MKKRNLATVTVLSLGMLLGSAPYAVLADTPPVMTTSATIATAITQEQALAIVKKLFPNSEDLKLESATLQTADQSPFRSGNTWMLNYSDGAFGPNRIWMNVILNADTGTLVNYNFTTPDDASIKNPITLEQARAKAEQYLKQFAPDKVANVKLIATPDQTQNGPSGASAYLFRFVRSVNGIPFPNDGATIRVNAKGDLRSYSFNWNDSVQLPDTAATPSLTSDQAKEVYRKAMQLQLQYQRQYMSGSNTPDLKLVYAPWGAYGNGELPVIDATKGVAINEDGTPQMATATDFTPLSDKPSAPLAHDLTQEEAIAIVAKLNVNLSGYTLEHAQYQTNYDGYSTVNDWTLDYTNGSNADSQHVNISINAKTGDVEHYMRFTPGQSSNSGNSPGTATLSRDQAQQKAIDFMKNAMSSKADQIAFDPASAQVISYPQSNDYQFRFVPLLDGLPVNGFIMDLSVNGTTGAIESFNADPASRLLFKHPAKDKAMSVEAAKDYYVQHNELQLQYIPIYETGASIYDRITKIKGVVLAYAPFQLGIPQVLNAVTGDWNPLYGGGSQANITDIKGHWAEKQLQYFADQGIFDVQDGKLDPNTTVTRGDVMKYLIVATSGARSSHNKAHFSDVPSTDPNYEHIEEAYARKWIDTAAKSFRPSDAMTREELADIVVRVLGYQKLASSPDAFKARFGDVNTTSPYFGDIAIVSSLGLMSGYDKTFTPHQKVTKAQLAVVLAKVMEQLQDKQGYPYF